MGNGGTGIGGSGGIGAVAEGLLCSGRRDALADCRLKLGENGAAATAGVGGIRGGSLLDDED